MDADLSHGWHDLDSSGASGCAAFTRHRARAASSIENWSEAASVFELPHADLDATGIERDFFSAFAPLDMPSLRLPDQVAAGWHRDAGVTRPPRPQPYGQQLIFTAAD